MKRVGPLLALLPFWLFALFFKFGAGLHYTLLSALGARILPIWVVGIIIGASSLLQLILDVPAGSVLDRWGYTRLLRLGTLFAVLGAVVLALFDLSLWVYLLTILLVYVGWQFFTPGIDAYTLASAGEAEGGKYMGLNHTFCSLGIVLSAIVTTLVITGSSHVMGLVVAIILAAALVAIVVTKPEVSSVHDRRHRHQSYYIRRHFLTKVVRAVARLNPASTLLALQDLAGSIFYAMIWFVVPLVIASQKGPSMLGIGLSVFDLAIVVLGAVLGRLADRSNKKAMILIGLLLFAVAGVLLGFNLNIFFLLLGFIATAGDEMSGVSLWSWLEELDKEHSEDGLVNGAIILFGDVGWMIGPIAAGFLFQALGPSLTIIIGAVPIVFTWLFAFFFLRRRQLPVPAAVRPCAYYPRRHKHKR